MNELCQYPEGCPLHPIVTRIALLTAESRSLYMNTRYTKDIKAINDYIAQADARKKEIEELNQKKNSLNPCPTCPFV